MDKLHQYPDNGLKEPVRSWEENTKRTWDMIRKVLRDAGFCKTRKI